MPFAVFHIFVPIILAALFRDFYSKKFKKPKFSLHYVLIAGIGGVLPDIDIIFFLFLQFFGFSIETVHRNFTHSFLFIIPFLVGALVTIKMKSQRFCNHILNVSKIFLALSFGIFIHLVLDLLFAGYLMPIYPISNFSVGFNLINYISYPLGDLTMPFIEGVILVIWLIYLEFNHKIVDFI